MTTNSTELEGWDQVIELAGQDNVPAQGRARAEAGKRQAYATANLGEQVFNAQKHISTRLDKLNERLDKSSQSSNALATKTFWLTIALVSATVVQAFAAIVVAFKK